jgi:hypothetical protein
MKMRSIGLGVAIAILMAGMQMQAAAAPLIPSGISNSVGDLSSLTEVRWVCGPRRCAWIPGYAGPVVVRPYMRPWVAPPRPYCHYVRGPRGRWALVCP